MVQNFAVIFVRVFLRVMIPGPSSNLGFDALCIVLGGCPVGVVEMSEVDEANKLTASNPLKTTERSSVYYANTLNRLKNKIKNKKFRAYRSLL
jgi:hypothetical protein